ncbi:MAG: glycoside hydrolase family 2 TIM barrel-domain containing protein, partial [Pyrinomonadaceae bacterium]
HLGPPPPAIPPPARTTSSQPRPQHILERISVRVTDPAGVTLPLKLTGGGGVAEDDYVVFEGKIPVPQLWSPERPHLYTVEAALGDDRHTDRFGFRSFEARDGKFYLNGEPFYMLAALDQDFYPETIYTAPSEEYIRDQMLKAKRLGLNLLRCHIKVCEPAYLKVADEVGMLVWHEIPSWNDFNHFSPRAAERGEQVLREMTERDWNHPSIVIQSVINESWGADLKQPAQRQWLKEAFDRAKQLLAPRGVLVVDNSACCDNFHVKSDIDDFHRYNSIPDYHADFDRWVADFATRPRWSYSPHGDAERTGREPLVVSEFGNWGLPKLPAELPWWFARDFGGREVTRPAGVLERFRQFHFGKLFRDYDALAEATQWHQFRSLKHEIEEIRRHAAIQGYVITEFTDINWEANGLLDMWRNPKAYAADLARIQQPDVIMLRAPKRNYAGGETIELQPLVSHYSGRDLKGAQVVWSGESSVEGSFPVERPAGRAEVSALKAITFAAPRVERPRRETIKIELRAAGGSIVAENSFDLFLFPKPAPASGARLSIHDPGNTLGWRPALAAAGYQVSAGAAGRDHLLLATTLDAAVARHLQSGGRAIILANSKEAFPAGSTFTVAPRAGDLDGNWVTNFNWVRADAAPFREVAFGPLLGFEGAAAVPRFVIQGVPPTAYADDVLSGIFYGWLNHNAALAVRMKAGAGKLVATTYRFDDYGRDPYATRLLDALIRHAAAPDFAPKLEWPGGEMK